MDSLIQPVSEFLSQHQLGTGIALFGILLTALCPIIAVPGQTSLGRKVTSRGWLAILVGVMATSAQAVRTVAQDQEERRRTTAMEEGFARLESKLEGFFVAGGEGIAGSRSGPIGGTPEPAHTLPSSGESPAARGSRIPAAIRAQIESLRQATR